MAGRGNDRQNNLGPLERGLSISLGALAATAALGRRRPVPASLLAGAAGLLLYRGISGRPSRYRRLAAPASEVGATVSTCSQVTVQIEAAEAHRRLRDLGFARRFSRYLVSARELPDGRWNVLLDTPLAGRQQLHLRRTADEEGSRLAWASDGESDFPAALELRFSESRTGTVIRADLWFVPPAPAFVATALTRAEGSRPLRRAGLTPSQLLEQELRRLRQLLEAGETSTVRGQSAGAGRAQGTGRRREQAPA